MRPNFRINEVTIFHFHLYKAMTFPKKKDLNQLTERFSAEAIINQKIFKLRYSK